MLGQSGLIGVIATFPTPARGLPNSARLLFAALVDLLCSVRRSPAFSLATPCMRAPRKRHDRHRTKYIRALVTVLGVTSSYAQAQTVATAAASRQAQNAGALMPDEVLGSPDGQAETLTAGRNGRNRLPSKNEAYNIARAAEGRVGIRLGNDLSFRISK